MTSTLPLSTTSFRFRSSHETVDIAYLKWISLDISLQYKALPGEHHFIHLSMLVTFLFNIYIVVNIVIERNVLKTCTDKNHLHTYARKNIEP